MKIASPGSLKRADYLSQLWKFWIFLNCHLVTVLGQCGNGFEGTCVWTHTEKSALRWHLKSDGREQYVELSNCEYPNCGIGILQSPWLPSREEGSWVSFHFKIYGTSAVYLRLYLMEEDNTQRVLVSKTGNYAFTFPETWSSELVALPPTRGKHKLILKAHTPYKEAVVAVKDINMDGSIIITSTNPATAEPEMEETTTAHDTQTIEEDFTDSTEIPDDYDYTNEIEPEEDEEEEEEDHFQALEINNFIGEEDLKKGYTTVVEPDICMYN